MSEWDDTLMTNLEIAQSRATDRHRKMRSQTFEGVFEGWAAESVVAQIRWTKDGPDLPDIPFGAKVTVRWSM